MNYEDFKNRNMNQKVLKIIFGVIGSILILKFFYRLVLTVFQYVFMSEKNLKERYGTNTWVMVTGPSGGIGKQLALKFAKRGFNICLVGNKKCTQVQSDIKKLNNNVHTHWIEADFSNENAYTDDWNVQPLSINARYARVNVFSDTVLTLPSAQ